MSAAGSYQLGVDLGTTYTAAAIARDGQVKMIGLGNRSAAIPSVVHLAADGTVLAGEAADRRGPSEPDRVAREFKRRIGDPTPLLLGGTPYSAEALLGTMLDAVVTRVSELEGARPSHLAVSHPANWGPYKQELFAQCLRGADTGDATALTEPEAAAIAYAANERVEPGSLVGVYDLGGGTFDVAILRKTTDGFAILGRPEGIERLGGIDFDEAVVGHVRGALGGALEQVDAADPAALRALTRLRRECVEAKEALSTDTDAIIPVLLPEVQTEVRLTRAEFERMIRPTLESTIAAMRRALVAAAVEPQQISAVLLVGGSSRIPLVAELVSGAFGRPIAVDAHPKHAVAQGAARTAALVTTDVSHPSHEARVIPFSTPATASQAAGAAQLHDAADLRPTADADTGSAAAAVAERPQRRWDRRPYDDEPEVPGWLLEARDGGRRTRRRWWTGIVAFVVLSLLTVGAGAFMTSDPRSEAFGDTWTVRGTPATENPNDGTADDEAPGQDAGAPPRTSGPSARDDDGTSGPSDGSVTTADTPADKVADTGHDGSPATEGDRTEPGPTAPPTEAGDSGDPAGAPTDPGRSDPPPDTPSETAADADAAGTPDGGGPGGSKRPPGASENPVATPLPTS